MVPAGARRSRRARPPWGSRTRASPGGPGHTPFRSPLEAPPPPASWPPLSLRFELAVFREGANRGRGGSAGAEIRGKARSPGQNVSRATPEAVNSGPPPLEAGRTRPPLFTLQQQHRLGLAEGEHLWRAGLGSGPLKRLGLVPVPGRLCLSVARHRGRRVDQVVLQEQRMQLGVRRFSWRRMFAPLSESGGGRKRSSSGMGGGWSLTY